MSRRRTIRWPIAALLIVLVAAYARLRELIVNDRTGWDVTHAAMATGGYVFRSPTLTANCFPNWIVLTYSEGGRAVQVIKKFENVPQRLGLPPAG